MEQDVVADNAFLTISEVLRELRRCRLIIDHSGSGDAVSDNPSLAPGRTFTSAIENL
jgi:hypothetical protein